MSRDRWAKDAGAAYLSEVEASLDQVGGAFVLSAEELVRRAHGRKVVARADTLEALALLRERGWQELADERHDGLSSAFVRRAASGEPGQGYARHFSEGLARQTGPLGRSRGPISVRDIGLPFGRARDGADLIFQADWGARCFAARGWRAATCPEGVDALDVAHYPPAKDGAS
ncbi:MAG: hypothetical protein MUF34_20140 [Polyangiaceae bacterium]|nr:hypothetical protein [Polyangiaceae bacterium]